MSGLDKIVGRISAESGSRAEAILNDAREKAAQIRADSERRTREECERIRKKADSQAAAIAERSKASAELKSKQILLSGRQEILNDTLGQARERLAALSDAEYAQFFLKLFKKHLPDGKAVLRLNAKDLARFGADTLGSIRAAAADAGAELEISETPIDIKDGFVLDYGGIEENCTFDALFDQNIEDLQDKVKAILFA